METAGTTLNVAQSRPSKMGYVQSSTWFDSVAAMLGILFVSGLYLDTWAHIHVPKLETFFTPWHGVLYSGFGLSGLFLLAMFLWNHQRGYAWRFALPRGYRLSLIGAGIFALGGVLDMFWHIINGVEKSIEALLSPTHLMLAFGMILIVSGPLRSAFARLDDRPSFVAFFPAIVSLLATYAVLTVFTQYAEPIIKSMADTNDPYNGLWTKPLGFASILLQTLIVMSFFLLALRRWRLPFGTFTAILTLHGLLTSFLIYHNGNLVGVTLLCAVAGVLIDTVYAALQPSAENVLSLRIFSFLTPFIYYCLYFVGLTIAHSGLAWSVNLWAGSIVVSGGFGLFLSYVAVPPQVDSAREA